MKAPFHLSLPVRSIEESVAFFEHALLATVSHRDPSGYVDLAVPGCSLTLHQNPAAVIDAPGLHFGINLGLDDFLQLAARLQADLPGAIVAPPKVRDAGTPRERHKMFLRCLSGYVIEIKGSREAT